MAKEKEQKKSKSAETATKKADKSSDKKKKTKKQEETKKKKPAKPKAKKKGSSAKKAAKKDKQKDSKSKQKSELPGKLALAKNIRPGYLVKVVHLSPNGKRDYTTQGVVMRVRGEGQNKTFTVRTVVEGVGLEKVFSFASPALKEIEIIKKKLARRARLYFLRSEDFSSAKKSRYLKGL